MISPEQQKEVMALASTYTVTIDRNINTLMGMAATNQDMISNELKDQFKIGTSNETINEKLL
jgi:hypothetical protein